MGSGYDAIVLARGTSRRLADVDKADLDLSGATLLERAVESVASAERVSGRGSSAAVEKGRLDP
jgi:molybdopterin-guanine dinucleotide biosynthesis protein A